MAGVAIASDRANISTALRSAEESSGKRLRDWHRTSPDRRRAYLTSACTIPALQGRVFYKIHRDCYGSNHMQLRGDVVQDAIARFASGNQRAIYYEGLT